MRAPATLADTVVAQSHAMQTALAAVSSIANEAGGFLITGEPGTGRRMVSRLIHESARRPGGYVEFACDALGPADAEAVLFGRTADPGNGNGGSQGSVDGGFECVWQGSSVHRAIGGTLCLLRVEDLPERAQAKLARILRDGEFRVGASGRAQAHGIRPVAITDGDFEQQVLDGRIRHDLHKRLSSATITVPPLRERRDDILRLADFFTRQACDEAALPLKTWTPPTQSLLLALPWWGNARELQSVVSSVVLKCAGESIDLDAILAQLKLDEAGARTSAITSNETLRAARSRFEREYITAVLTQHRGRIPDAAKSLGIQRTNLYRKLRSLHLRENH